MATFSFSPMALMLALLLPLLMLGSASANNNNELTCDRRVAFCNESVDYFDTKINFEFATSIKNITYSNTYVVLDMAWNAWSGYHEVHYVLVRCGCPNPNLPGYKAFFVPVSSIFLEETVVVPRINAIGQQSKLVAVERGTYITTGTLVKDLRNGVVVDIKNNYTLLYSLPGGLPDILLTGTGSTASNNGWTTDMADRQWLDADAGETHPLGRAELIKLVGMLTAAEDSAVIVFTLIKTRYATAQQMALNAKKRPAVMIGVPFSGSWTMSSGLTYTGRFLRDANVEFKNMDARFASMNISTVLSNFVESTYWINANYFQGDASDMTMDELVAGNNTGTATGDRAVFRQFRAFKCNEVWTNDAKVVAPNTGNPYYEEGVLRPDLILLDLITIFHGDTLPADFQYNLTFYRKVRQLTNTSDVGECMVTNLPNLPSANRSFLWAKFVITGTTQFAFLDRLYTHVKPAIARALGLADTVFEMFVSNSPAPTANGSSFNVEINIDNSACGQCGNNGPETLPAPCVALGERLSSLTDTFQTIMSANVSTAAQVSQAKASHIVCPSGASTALATLLPADDASSSSASLSSGAKTGIILGCCVGAALAAVAVFMAYRTGHARGYRSISMKKQQDMEL